MLSRFEPHVTIVESNHDYVVDFSTIIQCSIRSPRHVHQLSFVVYFIPRTLSLHLFRHALREDRSGLINSRQVVDVQLLPLALCQSASTTYSISYLSTILLACLLAQRRCLEILL